METTPLFWIIFNVLVLGMLWLDLRMFHREAHVVDSREALKWSLVWVMIALAFATSLYFFMGHEKGLEFLAGYVVEKSLSIDNIFVFSIIFQSLSIPLKYQHRVLFWGIFGALVFRGVMIWFGLELIAHFHAILYLLGGFLIFTGLKILWTSEEPINLESHPIILFLQRFVPLTTKIEGQQLWVRPQKTWKATPLFVALVLIEFSDIIFAIDSIPAIFAITLDPFIVYTSNVFAILGLRSLYFLLANALTRFVYLKPAISVLLCFVGIKMVVVDFYKIPTQWSLFIILLILGGSVLLSCRQGGQSCRK
jgi:tellurite resistance protein TerC